MPSTPQLGAAGLWAPLLVCLAWLAQSGRACAGQDPLCRAFQQLEPAEQTLITDFMNEQRAVQKRQAAAFAQKSMDPNFLRFGKRAAPSPNPVGANFLRFGKSAADPNFLRFGKRATDFSLLAAQEPNFLRFGKRAAPDPANNNNFLRFGRASAAELGEQFEREQRQNNNFLRFG